MSVIALFGTLLLLLVITTYEPCASSFRFPSYSPTLVRGRSHHHHQQHSLYATKPTSSSSVLGKLRTLKRQQNELKEPSSTAFAPLSLVKTVSRPIQTTTHQQPSIARTTTSKSTLTASTTTSPQLLNRNYSQSVLMYMPNITQSALTYANRTNRIPIKEIKIGKAYTGKVKNLIEHFGFFVDIGTVVDGLVHIGDISPTFFTKAVQNRVKKGQKVKVWVKDVDIEKNRIRLRMYPFKSHQRYNWSDLKVLQEVNGTVAKIADEALYLDIGAPLLAYLPRRNMKIPKGKGNYRVHELAPYNSTVRCFIREANERLKKLVVTTYHPDNWHIYLPPLSSSGELPSSRPYKGRFAEQEEIRRQKLLEREAFKRRMRGETSGSGTNYLDDEDDNEFGEYSDAESLTDDEITRLRDQRTVLIDDLQGNSTYQKPSKGKRKRMLAEAEDDRRLTTKQLFTMLCDGKDYITFKDFKYWWYVRMLKQAGDWDGRKFKEVMAEASGGYLRVYESQLDDFLLIFAKKFGIKTGEEEDYQDERVEERTEADHRVDLEDDDGDDMDDNEEESFNFTTTDVGPIEELTVEDAKWILLERLNKDIEDTTEFRTLLPTPRSRVVKWEHVTNWELSRLAIAANIISDIEMKALFNSCTNHKVSMNFDQFKAFAHRFKDSVQRSIRSKFSPASTSAMDTSEGNPILSPQQETIRAMPIQENNDLAEKNDENSIPPVESEEPIEYDAIMSKLYAKLCKGKSFLSFENLLEWEMVKDLMMMGKVDPDYLKEMIAMLNEAEVDQDQDRGIVQSINDIDFDRFKVIVSALANMFGGFEEPAEDTEEIPLSDSPVQSDDEIDGDDGFDVDDIFDMVAQGKELVTLKDILKIDWFTQFGISATAIGKEWIAVPSRSSLNRDQFEDFCINLLKQSGFEVEN